MKQACVIYLNGPSSSGKTTLAGALQEALDGMWLHVGIDKMISMMPLKYRWGGALEYEWRHGLSFA